MAWALEGSSSTAVALGASSVNVTLPGTPAEGDLVIVAVASDASCLDVVGTAGYTAPENTSGNTPGAYFGYKVMGATPDTVVNIVQDSGRKRVVNIQTWSGEDTSTPLDVAWSRSTGATNLIDPPGILGCAASALVVAVGFLDDKESSVDVWPSGYTNTLEGHTTGAGSNLGATIAMASKQSAGADENPGVFDMANADSWIGGTISFAIAGAGGLGIPIAMYHYQHHIGA